MHFNPYNGYFKIHLIGEGVKVVIIKVYLLINLAIQCVVWYYRSQNSPGERPLCETTEEKLSGYCAVRRTNIVLIKQSVNNCHFTIIPWESTIWFHGSYCVRSFPHSCRTLSDWGFTGLTCQKVIVSITVSVHTCDKNIACPVASSQEIPPRVSLWYSEAAAEGCSVCMSRHFLQLWHNKVRLILINDVQLHEYIISMQRWNGRLHH